MQNFTFVSDVPFDFEGRCSVSVDEAEYCFIKGKICHRLDGPAITSKSLLFSYYFINDIEYSEKQYWNHPLVVEYKLNKILKL